MRTLIGYIVYIIVQIIFIPLAIIGALVVFYKQVYVSKRLGLSATAIEVINGRWTMSKFGMRKDEATERLNKVLPNSSTGGLWLALIPLYLLYKITGKNLIYPTLKEEGRETLADLMIARTIYIDRIIEKNLSSVEQFCVMGAGYDTRCYRDMSTGKLKLFELDQPTTQQSKIKYLKEAQIDASKVQFVPVDFSKDHWYEKLKKAGYSEDVRSIFLWEGVTLYLLEKDVRKTLREIKEHTASGSKVILDIYGEQFVTGKMSAAMKKGMKTLEETNEQLNFGIPFGDNAKEKLSVFIQSEGLSLGDVHCMGEKTKKGTWVVVAEIII